MKYPPLSDKKNHFIKYTYLPKKKFWHTKWSTSEKICGNFHQSLLVKKAVKCSYCFLCTAIITPFWHFEVTSFLAHLPTKRLVFLFKTAQYWSMRCWPWNYTTLIVVLMWNSPYILVIFGLEFGRNIPLNDVRQRTVRENSLLVTLKITSCMTL